ncbi:hypothetical protein O181_023463 [Austropuccinia psidii MF-1]|uniref:Uncharacterized protein n=1 Tax=Austropuccinia psidii MF-1 TaxID=1389203 RepID=A0A9Q3CIU7_9BASI|nr:hypothetical protein [Austropuccinia psidii MF-1]
MSKEDQIILTSYASLVPVLKRLSKFNTSGISKSNLSQQPQQASTFSWCSGAHHSRTQLFHSKSISQIHSPFLEGKLQPLNLTIYGGDQKVIQGPQLPGFPGVVILFQKYSPKGILAQDSSREISRGCIHSNQFSRYQALQHSLDNSIGPYRWYSDNLYGIGPFGPIDIPLC